MTVLDLPYRYGTRPAVAGAGCEQLTQNSPIELLDRLVAKAWTLPGVVIRDSLMCVPGTRAWHLVPALARGTVSAFLIGTEFGHVHPPYDGSLHFSLPDEETRELVRKRWAAYPGGGRSDVLIYGPRNETEAAVAWSVIRFAHARARSDG